MKPVSRTLIAIAVTLIASLACHTTTAPPLGGPPEGYPENQPTVDQNITPETIVSTVAVQTLPNNPSATTLLYISGTTHIESKPQSWPDPDAFLTFLQQVTDIGMRWSVGADVGWLEGETRAAEVIQRSEAMGVQWDVHTHSPQDRAKAAYLITQMGGHPNSVVSGMLVSELDGLRQPLTFQGFTWTPQVLWGGAACAGHRPGCDDHAAGLWIPLSAEEYSAHDPEGTLVRVGGGTHQLNDGRALAQAIANGQYTYPVISFTVMVSPSTLTVVESRDDIEQLTMFVEEMNSYSFVRWANIEETANAWRQAGSIPSRIEME